MFIDRLLQGHVPRGQCSSTRTCDGDGQTQAPAVAVRGVRDRETAAIRHWPRPVARRRTLATSRSMRRQPHTCVQHADPFALTDALYFSPSRFVPCGLLEFRGSLTHDSCLGPSHHLHLKTDVPQSSPPPDRRRRLARPSGSMMNDSLTLVPCACTLPAKRPD